MYEVRSLTKSYGAAPALLAADLTARDGEIHALLGMNGAGKSTLVKIMVGIERPDAGELILNGRAVSFTSPRQAADLGIAVVAQDLNVFDQLSVLANVFLTREPHRFGLLDTTSMRTRAAQALALVGLDIDPRRGASTLSQSDKQRVAIARALLLNPSVLVLDEPTSALQPRETELLLDLVRRLRDSGTAIVYVSHFLQEVFRIADRVTVLRDGQVVVPGVELAHTSLPETVRAMAGDAGAPEALTPQVAAPTAPSEQQLLRVNRLSRRGEFEAVSFEARGGQVLGLAGLEGSGAREVLASIFGATPADSGSVLLTDGQRVGLSMPASVYAGLAYVPADRQQSGVMPRASIVDNLVQIRVATLGREPFLLRERNLSKRAAARVRQLGIKVGDLTDPLSSLSGGNQQKVLIGKWLEAESSVYLLDDPTAAVDVHARVDIHAVIKNLTAAGHIVILTSSDMTELLELSDRIAVLHQGRLAMVLANDRLSARDLLQAINTGEPPVPVSTLRPSEETTYA